MPPPSQQQPQQTAREPAVSVRVCYFILAVPTAIALVFIAATLYPPKDFQAVLVLLPLWFIIAMGLLVILYRTIRRMPLVLHSLLVAMGLTTFGLCIFIDVMF